MILYLQSLALGFLLVKHHFAFLAHLMVDVEKSERCNYQEDKEEHNLESNFTCFVKFELSLSCFLLVSSDNSLAGHGHGNRLHNFGNVGCLDLNWLRNSRNFWLDCLRNFLSLRKIGECV